MIGCKGNVLNYKLEPIANKLLDNKGMQTLSFINTIRVFGRQTRASKHYNLCVCVWVYGCVGVWRERERGGGQNVVNMHVTLRVYKMNDYIKVYITMLFSMEHTTKLTGTTFVIGNARRVSSTKSI